MKLMKAVAAYGTENFEATFYGEFDDNTALAIAWSHTVPPDELSGDEWPDFDRFKITFTEADQNEIVVRGVAHFDKVRPSRCAGVEHRNPCSVPVTIRIKKADGHYDVELGAR